MEKTASQSIKTTKKRTIIDDVMHFLVHNGFLFTVIVMCLVHVVLLGIMIAAGIKPLIIFNILSVIVYGFCIFLCRYGYIMPVYISIIIEVTSYTFFSSYFIGLKCGTYCFLFSIVPIIIYFGSYLFKGFARIIIVLMLALNFSVFVFLYIRLSEMPPIIETNAVTRLTLVIFSAFVMVFSTMFYNTIYIYTSENEVNFLEKKNEQLSVDATEDSLTGLLNRRGFLPIIEDLMKDKNNHFCVAFCDIDNFKRINDTYGHDGGDEVLRHIASMIKREMHGCQVCRWGGEEIVILMKDYDLAVAKEKMEYLRKSIEASQTVFFNKYISATITIGLEEINDSYNEPDDIIKVADERMYYGKQHGKNIVIWQTVSNSETA
ncbi:MAG: GGDEF domain-containing protein [Lachnospiraceae bacterium]|nr:GGDEF domain-containing protein [Lachnospiraceae bacterium]